MGVLIYRKRWFIYLLHILLQLSIHINAVPLRIAPEDWDLYVYENLDVFRSILWETGTFKAARRATCAIGGPYDTMVFDTESTTSLYYSVGTLKVALAGLQAALYNAITTSSVESEVQPFLDNFGFADISEAALSMHRLQEIIEAYEDLIKALLEAGDFMVSFPSTDYPTTSENHNIQELALMIEGGMDPGDNLEDSIIVDSDARSIFVDYWRTLLEEAEQGHSLAISDVDLAKTDFDTDGFTALIKDRSTDSQNPDAVLTVSGLLERIERILACWMIRSQTMLVVLERLGALPEPISRPRWMSMQDGQEVIGSIESDEEES